MVGDWVDLGRVLDMMTGFGPIDTIGVAGCSCNFRINNMPGYPVAYNWSPQVLPVSQPVVAFPRVVKEIMPSWESLRGDSGAFFIVIKSGGPDGFQSRPVYEVSHPQAAQK